MSSQMIFTEAKKTDLVTLLAQLGFTPDKIRRQDYWYKSPFREEHTASFKVNRDRNIYYDHGEGAGGNVIDFAARFFSCDAQEAAKKLLELQGANDFSFHQRTPAHASAGEKKEPGAGTVLITDVRSLQNRLLLSYLEERKIPLQIAQHYCKEVDFSLYGKQHTVIGFENRQGGFELRSATYKGSSAPKDVTFFDNGKHGTSVFEGFFDFLSFATRWPQSVAEQSNCLILNSLSFFEKSRSLMEQYPFTSLYLDHGKAGRSCTQKALEWNRQMDREQYSDASRIYRHYEDLNAWHVAQATAQQQQLKRPGRTP